MSNYPVRKQRSDSGDNAMRRLNVPAELAPAVQVLRGAFMAHPAKDKSGLGEYLLALMFAASKVLETYPSTERVQAELALLSGLIIEEIGQDVPHEL